MVALARPASAGSAPPTLLLLPFDNATGDPGLAGWERGVPDLLAAVLSRHTGLVRVVEREQLDAIARERSLSWQQYVAQTSLNRMGSLSQARYVARGSFTRTGDRLHVQALVYETETTRLVASAEARGAPATLVSVCEELADRIAKALPTNAPPSLPVDDDPERSLLMIQGLGHFYSSQFNKAVPAFMKILAKHPDDALARYWLARSFYEAGLRQHAAIELQAFLNSSPNHVKAAEVRDLLGRLEEGGRRR
ncbi:MAG TPA: CsgG/HfaB family protein [Methylomirabilota bacterium]